MKVMKKNKKMKKKRITTILLNSQERNSDIIKENNFLEVLAIKEIIIIKIQMKRLKMVTRNKKRYSTIYSKVDNIYFKYNYRKKNHYIVKMACKMLCIYVLTSHQ